MLFNSLEFLLFFPAVVLVNFCLPKRVRYLWLLAASYFFYMCWNAKYALLLLFSTAVTYGCGLALERIKNADLPEEAKIRRKKQAVAVSFILNLSVLAWFKYVNFGLSLLQQAFSLAHVEHAVPRFDILLPVGISFFTFQALGYTMDVYRGEIYAEKNFFRYALFVSFFPQLVAGPIERSKNLLKQLAKPADFCFEDAREGVLLMLWGYFLKVVLADRTAIFVDTVYGNIGAYPGLLMVLATFLFSIQIYCDFAGYSTIAMGAARILGIQLMENFDAPYLSASVAEFWRRWHISLSSWFRDYLYIPLGGSRQGKARKYRNILIVFLLSGLWHGADITFCIWGGLNGIYQIIGEVTLGLRQRIGKALGIQTGTKGHTVWPVVTTAALVDFSWIFFRAGTTAEAFAAIRSIFTVFNPWVLFDGSVYRCGLDPKNFWLMIACIGLLFAADLCKKRGIRIRDAIIGKPLVLRSFLIACAISAILLFGIWGPGYDATSFIYFQF